MTKILVPYLFGSLLLCTPTMLAQKTDTAPPGFNSKATTDLLDYSMWFGAFRQARYQLAVSSPNQSAKTITQIDFRQEDKLFAPTAKPRSWINVTLRMAETNASMMSATWSTNVLTTPTTVYNGHVHFTDMTQPISKPPARWGAGGPSFPFSKPFVYTAKRDLLSDFVFTGGLLSNQATWNTTPGSPYILDGISSRTFSGGTATVLGNPLVCKDSGQPWAGHSAISVVSYAQKTGNTKLDNRFGYLFHHQFLPRNANVIVALGLQGTTKETLGLNVGACRFLMISPLLFLPLRTDAKGGGETPRQLIPYDGRLVGTKLWVQSAYNDSVTSAFSLSMGTLAVIEAQPPVRPWQAPWVYLSDPRPASGQLTKLHAPLQRLTFK